MVLLRGGTLVPEKILTDFFFPDWKEKKEGKFLRNFPARKTRVFSRLRAAESFWP